MSLPTFPILPGQGWSVKKTPVFSTRVASHVSGREVRAANYAHALYEFELTFNGLASSSDFAGLGKNSLQTLLGFYLQCQGQFATFLYSDPTDGFAGNSTIATGDGVTTGFAAMRTLGGAFEPVGYVTSLASVTVNGTAVAGCSVTAPNLIVLPSPPASGAAIAASFQYAYLCRFIDDRAEFENFMAGLWKMGSLKFRSVR